MQVIIVLVLEFERLVGRLEESEERAVVEPIKCMQRVCFSSALGLGDLERSRQFEPQKILVKAPRLLGIAATIGVVVKTLDHGLSLVTCACDFTCWMWPRTSAAGSA